ncbi:unnamed protein product [Tilletia laevis]|uniref:Uncharacterized protein n=2 Tax=Tilletia TaxID=13289 RepID=A0A9N8LS18_9BASI|nr:hypothetical protein CF336_g6819 [Tilletia laevis]KAE8242411.1 hypothetical protein A4X03_0g8043 [Tilletia caries]CAD6938190.1 unnamed protein product [Tilletia laevis]CAD6949274.1 unnamed protein product [Tilletia laevis]CAD7064560.1 unnamed protein product [Tilletia caries]
MIEEDAAEEFEASTEVSPEELLGPGEDAGEMAAGTAVSPEVLPRPGDGMLGVDGVREMLGAEQGRGVTKAA